MPKLILSARENSLSVFVSWNSFPPNHFAKSEMATLLSKIKKDGISAKARQAVFSPPTLLLCCSPVPSLPSTKPQATRKLTRRTPAMADQVRARRCHRNFLGTPRCSHTMSPGSAAFTTFTAKTGFGGSPIGKRGSSRPGSRPHKDPDSLYRHLAQKPPQRCKHAIWSSWNLKLTTTTPEDFMRDARPAEAELRSAEMSRNAFCSSCTLGSVGSSLRISSRRILMRSIFPLNSSASQPMTTLTISVSDFPRTACSRKNCMICFSSVARAGRPLTITAKSLGEVVSASTLRSVMTRIWYA
mmetsp:Transcript_74064/g.187847  ORF Transcript_74064/g.187847 Transcript_74064/m.187847 type:complete len:299 (-) Transcript_74064:251-1147(-)